jgi:hypothetical protein
MNEKNKKIPSEKEYAERRGWMVSLTSQQNPGSSPSAMRTKEHSIMAVRMHVRQIVLLFLPLYGIYVYKYRTLE